MLTGDELSRNEEDGGASRNEDEGEGGRGGAASLVHTPVIVFTLDPFCSRPAAYFLKNTVIERPQLTGMGVIRCYDLLKCGIIRFKCINK